MEKLPNNVLEGKVTARSIPDANLRHEIMTIRFHLISD